MIERGGVVCGHQVHVSAPQGDLGDRSRVEQHRHSRRSCGHVKLAGDVGRGLERVAQFPLLHVEGDLKRQQLLLEILQMVDVLLELPGRLLDLGCGEPPYLGRGLHVLRSYLVGSEYRDGRHDGERHGNDGNPRSHAPPPPVSPRPPKSIRPSASSFLT